MAPPLPTPLSSRLCRCSSPSTCPLSHPGIPGARQGQEVSSLFLPQSHVKSLLHLIQKNLQRQAEWEGCTLQGQRTGMEQSLFFWTYISILLSGMFCCWELLEVSSQLSPRVALGFHLSLRGRLCIHVREWPLGWLGLLSFHEMALGLIYRS